MEIKMSGQTQQQATTSGVLTIGVDLGDRRSSYCVLDQQGEVIEKGVVTSTPLNFERHFQKYPRSLVAIEVCYRASRSMLLHSYPSFNRRARRILFLRFLALRSLKME